MVKGITYERQAKNYCKSALKLQEQLDNVKESLKEISNLLGPIEESGDSLTSGVIEANVKLLEKVSSLTYVNIKDKRHSIIRKGMELDTRYEERDVAEESSEEL